MSETQDAGSSAEDTQTTGAAIDPNADPEPEPKEEPKPEKKSKSKADKVPDQVLKCSNGCGFNTRWPKAQALKVKDAKNAEEPYMCPQCDLNGMSSKLVPYP